MCNSGNFKGIAIDPETSSGRQNMVETIMSDILKLTQVCSQNLTLQARHPASNGL